MVKIVRSYGLLLLRTLRVGALGTFLRTTTSGGLAAPRPRPLMLARRVKNDVLLCKTHRKTNDFHTFGHVKCAGSSLECLYAWTLNLTTGRGHGRSYGLLLLEISAEQRRARSD